MSSAPVAETAHVKVAIAVESPAHWDWVAAADLQAHEITAVPFVLGEGLVVPGGRRVGCTDAAGLAVPSLAELVEGLRAEAADACLVVGDTPGARIISMAADLLGLSVFSLVSSDEQLDNLSRRNKARPDLVFVAVPELLPRALLDSRYGSTVLPTGNPICEPVSAGGQPATAGIWPSDGSPAARILAAIDRWRLGTLEPPQPLLSVIVPAFREAANLPLVCERLLNALEGRVPSYEILLVDDASPDETYQVGLAETWRSPRIRALTKPPPRGMGNAIRFGLERARSQIVAITMGDGSDEVDRIPEMFARVNDDGFALAIGSRYRHRRNYQTVPWLYRFWSACFRLCTRLAIGLRLSDYTNAFRVFHRRIFARYSPESGGFEISPETTFKAWFATRQVTEVDVRHLKRASGQSSFSFLRAGPGYGRILTKAFLNRLTGRWFTIFW